MIQDFINSILGADSDSSDVGKKADDLIEKCSYAAAAVTLFPIPGSEIVAVMPIHVGMVIGISTIYGHQMTQSSATKLVLEILATAGISLIGSRIAITTSKILLPGLGGLIGAPLIFASTMAIGAVAKAFFINKGTIDKNEIKSIYEECVKSAKSVFDKNKMHSDDAEKMAKASVSEASADDAKAGTSSPVARLEQLKDMLSKGLIDQAEYDETKKRILSQM